MAQALTVATARKDSAAANKLNDDISALLTLDAKADSIAGARKCGVMPAKPDAVTQIDALQATADGFTRQIKTMEAAADSVGARAAAVAPARFTQMRERLVQFIANDSAFADKEGDVLKARKAEIEAVIKT